MVTIEEIAKRANVSRYTASKVLNGDLSVRKSTREKIFFICKECNYIPNLNAVTLVRGESPLLGLILPYISDGFYSRMVEKLEHLAKESSQILIYKCSYNDREKEREAIMEFLSLKVSALFIVPVVREPDQNAHDLALKNVPVIYLDRPFSPDTVCVLNDNYSSACCMTEQLLSRTKDIAFLASFYGEENPTSAARKKGYIRTMEKYGLSPKIIEKKEENIQQDNETYGYKVMKKFFSSGGNCDGIFCITDAAALGAYKAILEAGREPGKDFFIGGHDNLPFSAYLSPPLTTMEQPVDKMCRKVFSLLFQYRNGITAKKKCHYYKSRLIKRAST